MCFETTGGLVPPFPFWITFQMQFRTQTCKHWTWKFCKFMFRFLNLNIKSKKEGTEPPPFEAHLKLASLAKVKEFGHWNEPSPSWWRFWILHFLSELLLKSNSRTWTCRHWAWKFYKFMFGFGTSNESPRNQGPNLPHSGTAQACKNSVGHGIRICTLPCAQPNLVEVWFLQFLDWFSSAIPHALELSYTLGFKILQVHLPISWTRKTERNLLHFHLKYFSPTRRH